MFRLGFTFRLLGAEVVYVTVHSHASVSRPSRLKTDATILHLVWRPRNRAYWQLVRGSRQSIQALKLRGPLEKFAESPYYSESELYGGAVTVSFSKYLSWQAMHFLQRSTHFSKTCCRPSAASFRRIVEQAVLTSWSLRNFLRDLGCMPDVLMGFHQYRWAHQLPLQPYVFNRATLTLR
jgi:hypothetical protein